MQSLNGDPHFRSVAQKYSQVWQEQGQQHVKGVPAGSMSMMKMVVLSLMLRMRTEKRTEENRMYETGRAETTQAARIVSKRT